MEVRCATKCRTVGQAAGGQDDHGCNTRLQDRRVAVPAGSAGTRPVARKAR